MKHRIVVGIVAASFAFAGRASAESKSPLAPLVPLGDRMEKIMDAVIAGGDGKAAAGDWTVVVRDDVKKDLTAAGAKKSRLAGYELSLVLGAEKDNDNLELIVHASSRASALLAIKARTNHGWEKSKPIDDLKGAQKPFAEAARAVLASASAKGSCLKLPMADDKLMGEVAPGPIGEEARKKFGKPDAKTCEAFERAKTPVRVGVDDVLMLALDKDGKAVGGVRVELALDDKGGVKVEVRRYKSLVEKK